ncbi:MAG: hypothetical protein D6800_00370, partial [Candidatus Zixiibacteriota bacterium]
DYRLGRAQGPRLGENFYPLENFGINVLVTAGSGLPYSPVQVDNEVTLGARAPVPSGPRNSRRGPWTWRIDLKAERAIYFGDFKVTPFIWVKNLLDRDNALTVYETSGRPNTTTWLDTPPGQAFLDKFGEFGAQQYNLAENNPRNYDIPRMIIFGLRASF